VGGLSWTITDKAMGDRDLDPLFAPSSIAVFGASERPESVGFKVYTNLLESVFAGDPYAINPKYQQLLDKPCYPSLEAIGKSPDLAVIVTPARTVLSILKSCGEVGRFVDRRMRTRWSPGGDWRRALHYRAGR
jgi:acetyltransferase